jgi:hypothetical protein
VLREALPGAFTTSSYDYPHPGELLYFKPGYAHLHGLQRHLPVQPLARSLANLETVIGQLFLAILLASLVSQQARPLRP